jgi:hypothetical protein
MFLIVVEASDRKLTVQGNPSIGLEVANVIVAIKL